jgi:hypothetical protein
VAAGGGTSASAPCSGGEADDRAERGRSWSRATPARNPSPAQPSPAQPSPGAAPAPAAPSPAGGPAAGPPHRPPVHTPARPPGGLGTKASSARALRRHAWLPALSANICGASTSPAHLHLSGALRCCWWRWR